MGKSFKWPKRRLMSVTHIECLWNGLRRIASYMYPASDVLRILGMIFFKDVNY